ncbi:uncharacterized protein LOC144617578 isoform X2 [Crassostrea virginica]
MVDSHDCRVFKFGCPSGSYFGSTVYKYPRCVSIGNGCFLAEPSCESASQQTEQECPQQINRSEIPWIPSLLGVLVLCTIAYIVNYRRRKKALQRQQNSQKKNQQTMELNATLSKDSNSDACLAENVDPENPQISSGQTGVSSLQLGKTQEKLLTVPSSDSPTTNPTEILLYETTPETVNLFRIARLILDLCNDAMRDLMQSKVPGGELGLTKKIACSKTYLASSRLSKDQERLLFPPNNAQVQYKSLDFTLMYALVRNVFHEEIEPNSKKNNKWGKRPTAGEVGPVVAIESIRGCRNAFFAHASSTKVDKKTFDELWTTIEGAVGEIDNHIDRSVTRVCYKKEMDKMKTDPIDPQLKEILKNQIEKEKQLLKMEDEKNAMLEELINITKKYGCKTDGNTFRHPTRDEKSLGSHREPHKNKKEKDYEESEYEKNIFCQWENDDHIFVSTKAAVEVSNAIKTSNLVIVVGHSGSGKSAIVQHIALEYRTQGWVVKPVYSVEEIHHAFKAMNFIKDKTIFVFNDPIGKESFDEMPYHAWGHYRETLGLLLKHAKLLLTCRKSVFSDERARRLFTKEGDNIDIEQNHIRLSKKEKELMIAKHFKAQPTDDEIIELLEIDIYFPLLCKMWSRFSKYEKNDITFFSEPAKVLTEEIYNFKDKDKKKYCALVCFVLFNGELRLRDLKGNNKRFTTALRACELSRDTLPSTIFTELKALDGLLVKQIGDTYTFYHDFVMEVTTYVIGREHPEEAIKFADISFLRKRVRLENNNPNEQFTIVINDDNIDDLVNRLFDELLGDKFIEVILNPCLQEERISNGLITKFKNDQEKLEMMIKAKPKNINYDDTLTNIRNMTEQWYSRLDFVSSGTALSPLFALIAFQHDTLSCFCLDELKQRKCDFKNRYLFAAACCNGKMDLTEIFTKDLISQYITEEWDNMYPVHIASLFHNYELLNDISRNIKDVNMFTNDDDPWTPLLLASANNSEDEINCRMGELAAHRRDETVKLLIQKGADVNLCRKNGASPLFIACQNGHESTVQLLLNNSADVNLCEENGCSPLYITCQQRHESTAQLFLNNGADVNLCEEDGCSPLYIACQKRHESTAQLLLNNGADVNLCEEDGCSPLYIACQEGHESIAQLLLNNGADVNLCKKNGAGPLYIACQNGHKSTAQLLLKNGADVNLCEEHGCSPLYIACQNGHESTAQLLLNNGADVNLCQEHGCSPLYIACQIGHESTAQLLLNNGADVNLCEEHGSSPLYIACQNGHESTAQVLLINGADVNLCQKNSAGPLYIACQNGHESTAQLLLNNGAEVNICMEDGSTPLHGACFDGHERIAQLLLNNGADVNLCEEDGCSPLYKTCQNGHESTARLLLAYGADVNLCKENGARPLHIACQNGHETIAQFLLNSGAQIFCLKNNGNSPLYMACRNARLELVNILFQNIPKMNQNKQKGVDLLCAACYIGDAKIVQFLLSKGLDVNSNMRNGLTPLIAACYNGHDSIVHTLLEKGADVNSFKRNGTSSLYVACLNGSISTVDILLENSANVHKCKTNGTSPVFIASEKGHKQIVELLLNKGANIYARRNDGASPLYVASSEGRENTVQLLLDRGAEVNLCKNNGASPLFAACQNGHDATVLLLLEYGALVNVCMNNGTSPLFAACFNGHDSTVQLLLRKGADVNLCRNDGHSPLSIACLTGVESTTHILLSNEAKVNPCSFYEVIPLIAACYNGNDDIVKMLLNNGAEVNTCKNNGVSPLYLACQNGYETTVQILLDNNADVKLCLKDGTSPVRAARINGHKKIVHLLLHKQALGKK